MISDWLLLSVDTSAITGLILVARLGCLYGRNEIQPATLSYVQPSIGFHYCEVYDRLNFDYWVRHC